MIFFFFFIFLEALQYVKSSLPSYVPVTRIIKLLTTVAKRNDADLLRKFFNQLYIHGYITKMSSSILNLFIEFHISRYNESLWFIFIF